MKLTIAFFEEFQENGERNTFQNTIKNMNISLYHNWNDLSSAIPIILFFHGSNESELNIKSDFGSSLYPELSKTWLIEFGGYDTDKRNRGDRIVSYIKYSDLHSRLAEILDEINRIQEITKEKLEEIIFSNDSILEELFEPFATYHPLDRMTSELKSHRTKLLQYIEDKLIKQS